MPKAHNKYEFDGEFTRVSPADFAEKLAFPLGWFVVRFDLMADKAARREAHGKWFAIKSDHKTIYRMLRFSVNLTGATSKGRPEMVLDWAGWIDLYDRVENVDPPLQLKVRLVPRWMLPWVYLRHPDPAVRLSSWLGWGSILLGLLSVALTVAPWLATHHSNEMPKPEQIRTHPAQVKASVRNISGPPQRSRQLGSPPGGAAPRSHQAPESTSELPKAH